MKAHAAVFVSLAFLSACGGNASSGMPQGGAGGNIGVGGSTVGSGGAVGFGGDTASCASAKGKAGPATGTWVGYVELYSFDDGTDTITMTIGSTGPPICGHVRLGQAPLLPPPTDPNTGYPADIAGPPGSTPGLMQYPTFRSGFEYTILDGTFDGERLKFHIATNEVWNQWCALQTPVADDANAGAYTCLPNWGGGMTNQECYLINPTTKQKLIVDCGKFAICESQICQCTQQGCVASLGMEATFDMQITPPTANGAVAGFSGAGTNNVHLKRQ